ncbi:GerMN domain-containing protein [Neomicrococcus lactis]|uniref:GerMN domain-containing protein n=1 Tax=Neomicrococcus lactis TaxID=732241 RepID=UPI0022FFE37E|nr:GerMN domain-containing protein [Neomicrococcus lactis]
MPSLKCRARIVIAGTVATGTVLLAAVGCSISDSTLPGGQSSMPTKSSTSASVAVPTATDAKLEDLGVNQLSPVYWLGENGDNVFLYREFLPVADQGDPVVTSVKHMLEAEPADPDYFNVWSSAKRIGATISAENVITVDISSDAFDKSVDKGLAERSIQQLVYTATAAAANSGLLTGKQKPTVSIVVDGRQGYNAWGLVKLDRPLARADSMRAPVWLIDPSEASSYGSPIKAFGVTSKFSGGSFYSVAPVNNGTVGAQVADGVLAEPDQLPKDGEFRFEVTLKPGTYQLSVWGQNKNSDIHIATDTKTFTVR